jgi:hypothetical protein
MVKRTLLVALSLLWFLTGCGGTPESDAPPPPTRPPTDTPAPTATPLPKATPEVAWQLPKATPKAAWQEFTSEEGGFAVLMPSEPLEQIQPASTPDSTENHMFMARHGETAAFGVAYTDLPEDMASVEPEAMQNILDLGRDGALASMGGTLLAEEVISLEGFPGRHIEFALPEERFPGGGQGVLRVYLVGSRAYQVLALAARDHLVAEDVDRFLSSFRLLDIPAPPAADGPGPEVGLDAAPSGAFASPGPRQAGRATLC